jgi:hypothetical protein
MKRFFDYVVALLVILLVWQFLIRSRPSAGGFSWSKESMEAMNVNLATNLLEKASDLQNLAHDLLKNQGLGITNPAETSSPIPSSSVLRPTPPSLPQIKAAAAKYYALARQAASKSQTRDIEPAVQQKYLEMARQYQERAGQILQLQNGEIMGAAAA